MATKTTIKSKSTTTRTSAPTGVKTQSSVVRAKKTCLFCDNKNEPTFTDAQTLKKFMNDRARIVAHTRTGLCSKHQRHVATEIKHARHLALLPFVAGV